MVEDIRKWIEAGNIMPVCKLVGMSVDGVDAGKAKCSMVAGERHWNPFGTVHGGILCDLTDLTMGMAFMTTLGPGEGLATIEMKINFFRPAKIGRLSAEAKVLHRGRLTGFVECEVVDEADKLVVKASCTCMVVRDERAVFWNRKED